MNATLSGDNLEARTVRNQHLPGLPRAQSPEMAAGNTIFYWITVLEKRKQTTVSSGSIKMLRS